MVLSPDSNSVIPVFKRKTLRREHCDRNHRGSEYGSLVLNQALGFLLDANKYGNTSANCQEVRPSLLPSSHRLSWVERGQDTGA